MTIDDADQGRQGRLRADTCTEDWIYDRDVETASSEDVRAMADAAWERQWAGLLDRSGFYKRKYQAAGVNPATIRTVADLQHLPLTTKSELKDEQQAYPPFGDHLGVPIDAVKRVYQTSGTTGDPSLLALTAYDLNEVWGTIALRAYYGSGFHSHSGVATNFGAGPFVAGTTHRVLERLGCRTVPIAPSDTERLIKAMELGIVDSLLGTPSFMLYLAARFEKDSVDAKAFGITHINVGGEPGAGIPAVRSRMEDTFGAQITEIMGLGDITPSLFGECPAGGGMHFTGQGHVWMELRDADSGENVPVEPGAEGEPVYTHLTREAMPLVRFRSGDHVVIQDANCACGRTSFRIRCVGRVDDMIIVRGVNVYPSAIQSIVADFRPRVTGRSRVVLDHNEVSVTPPVPVEVEIPNGANVDDTLIQDMQKAIREKLLFRADLSLVQESDFGGAGYKTRGLVRGVAAT
jgi:phenylacetate-CoA ligase